MSKRSRGFDRQQYNKEYYRKNARKFQAKRFGITVEDWENVFSSQGCVCAICGTDVPGHNFNWDTDHCHATNKVRGILCRDCNRMLGGARDNPEILKAAIAYLYNPPADAVLH